MNAFVHVSPKVLADFDLINSLNHFAERVLDQAGMTSTAFPRYDVYAREDGAVFIDVACAGFAREDLTVEESNGVLKISGASKRERAEGDSDDPAQDTAKVVYFARGIARRNFRLRFPLRPGAQLKSAKYRDGVLTVELASSIHPARQITIG